MIEIIPAIDLIDGKCVRLSQGDYAQKKIYNENPLDVAKMFEDNGLKRLHLVDLDGAKSKHVVNYNVLEKIAKNTNLVIDFGGGIKTDDDIRLVLESGAQMVTVGSIAIQDKLLFKSWLDKYSNFKIILGADVKNRMIAITGWLDVTSVYIDDFLTEYSSFGVRTVLCTDISKDGMLQGTSLELYKDLQEKFTHTHFIASGGITHISEIDELNKMGISGVVIGKAIYEGKIKVEELKRFVN